MAAKVERRVQGCIEGVRKGPIEMGLGHTGEIAGPSIVAKLEQGESALGVDPG